VSWFGESWAAGDELPPIARVVTREDVAAYAEASGDRNPLHLDDDAARAAGFDGVIAHGMFTMGHLATAVAGWVGQDALLRWMKVQFRSPVSMGETIVARALVRSIDAELGTVVLDASVTVEREGRREQAVRRGEVEIVALRGVAPSAPPTDVS
jgi:meromycolic acid (3R)-3-hydroxyacyl-[acyl-carrier protein] dehydratase HadB